MLEPKRLASIRRIVQERGTLTVADLVAATGVSPATLRRDLAKLAASGLIRRVHGGVEALGPGERPLLATQSFDDSATRGIAAKRAIARAAVALCAEGESIIINAGTTTFQMVEFLRDRALQIVTNSFPIAAALIGTSRNRILLPGGELYREQGIILSPFDGDTLQHVAAARMFMSCASIGPLGVIEGDPLIARAEAKLLDRAADLIVLADASKFTARGSLAVCPLTRVRLLITDAGTPDSALKPLRDAGVPVLIAPAFAEEPVASAA